MVTGEKEEKLARTYTGISDVKRDNCKRQS
jgi:hypothetical protein